MSKSTNTVNARVPKQAPSKLRIAIFSLEFSLIIILLIVWFSSETLRKSKNLWILFFYNFPSQFLISIVPHEPVFLYFSKFYSPLVVTLVAIAGVLPAEILNYSIFKFVSDLKSFRKVHLSKIANHLLELFKKKPFVALLVAGFLPVPFFPFRFLVVLARYPLLKYVLAVFFSRTPRFFLIALLGHIFKIPDYALVILFIALGISLALTWIRIPLKKSRRNKTNVS